MSEELTKAQEYISWLNTKVRLNAIAPNAARRIVKRGQVYWCHFGLNIGSEMSKVSERPAVVVSNYSTNQKSANVIVVPITHNPRTLPYLVPITPIKYLNGQGILDGQADTADIICVSKARLGDLITTLPDVQMKAIDKSIAISLELLHYYQEEKDKYDKFAKYVETVKSDRNKAQDVLTQLKEIISKDGFDEKSQKRIKELLDI